MGRYGWLLGLAAALALVFLVLGDVGFRPPPVPDAGALDLGNSRRARAEVVDLHLVSADASRVTDAAWDEATLTEEQVRRLGLLGLESRWIETVMREPDNVWVRDVDRGGPTWRDQRLGAMVTFVLEDGRVSRVRADFKEGALSASATALSWIITGNREALPFHLEGHEAPGVYLEGADRTWAGRPIFWRAQLNHAPEPPYGPAWFEVSDRPLPPLRR